MRREPGQIMSSDATFSLAAITLSDGQMMVFLMGENADVIRWFVTRTESFDELKVGLLRLRDCLAASGKLDLLQFWWTDTCCERCANTPEKMREHTICEIFPKMRRRPYGDSFHGVKILTQACGSVVSREAFANYCKEVGQAFSKPLEEDILTIAEALLKRDRDAHRKNPSRYPAAFQISHYEKKVKEEKTWDYAKRREKRRGEEIAAALSEIFERYSTEPGWLREDLGSVKRGTKPIFDNIIKCAKKGCYSDPLPTKQMYRTIGETKDLGLKIYRYKGGSGKNETLHSALKRLLPYYSTLGMTKMQRAISLIIYDYNQAADVKNHLCDGTVGFAFLKQQLNRLASGVLARPVYPVMAAGPRVLNLPGPLLWKETQGFEYHEEMKRLQMANQMEETIATFSLDDGAADSAANSAAAADSSSAGGVSTQLAVSASADASPVPSPRSAHTVKSHRVAQKHVMPLLFEQPLKDVTTKDQVELLALTLTELQTQKPNLTGSGPISRELAARYLQKFTINSMLDEGNMDHDWGYGLRGKLKLIGIIDANTILKHYSKIGSEAAKGRLGSSPRKRPTQQQLPAQRPQQMRKRAAAASVTSDTPCTQVTTDPDPSMNAGASQLLRIAYSPKDGGAEPKKAKATTFRDKTRGRAQELVASCTRLKRKAENQFVVEGEEKVLAATTGDVEVLRSYAKAAKRSGAPIKLGGRGTVGAQASHLTGQLEQFFRDHNSGSDTFTPGWK